MEAFTKIKAPACPLDLANVDTDQLIPARFMKEPRSVGYDNFLLYDLRFDAKGDPISDFVLNTDTNQSCKTIVSRRNFGAGSSREAAVYALVDYGIRCVVAPSFGDIFSSNSVNNGLVPAIVSEDDCDRLFAALNGKVREMSVDLAEQTVSIGEVSVSFDIRPVWKKKLLNGWDDIDLTLQEAKHIQSFQEGYFSRFNWLSSFKTSA
ncbi:3-isopropylmalate dehydratase small subunit [Terasakiella pusilla]|uniref:3-isopropylmalate dehydratase small subunit n=1 Tax=Terasakiella pusilla TaxID=64973 RepID=UPI003AA89E70